MIERIRELIREKLGESEFEVLPADPSAGGRERGHFSTNAAFILAKQADKLPLQAAEELKKYLEEKGAALFSKIEIAEPGFINFWMKPEVIREEFEKMVKNGLKPFDFAQGKVIVEYSQPNIAKPLQAHHLRSTIIGDALANILEFAGHEVIRWNYLGDWGTHFGRLIAAVKAEKSREEWPYAMRDIAASVLSYARYSQEAKENPRLEEQAREEFRKLEQGDEENRKLWEENRSASIEKLKEIYSLLGIHFDEWTGESFYEKWLPTLIDDLLRKGIAKESEGAVIIPLERFNLPPALIRKSDGATLYLTRDIASLEDRIKNHKADTVLYVVDNGQSLHFQQLFAITEIIGVKGNFHHIKFGLLLGRDLKKLSTREGTGIELEHVVNEAINRARQVLEEKEVDLSEDEKEEVAKMVGIGALKYNDLSQNRVADIAFDWDKMLSLQGNSAPYLQYTYARLRSILRRAGVIDPVRDKPSQAAAAVQDADRISNGIEKEADLRLILKLAFFPEVIKAVSENYFPHQIANYLYDLARAINDYYEKEPVLKAGEGLRAARLNLVNSAAEIMKTGLGLLGIKVPERM